MRGDWELAEELRKDDPDDRTSPHGLLWQAVANNQAFGGLLAGSGDSFVNMLINSPKQYESVLQTANRNTEFIDSPAMQRLLAASDFQLSELKTRPEGMSLYLCLPQRYMNTHFRWLRMMIGLTVTEMEKVRGRPATGHPVLMLLDEFAALKRMETIENAVAQIAGQGVKMFFVLQSLEQLKAVYKDNWETFLANSGLKVFFDLEDYFSREYVSKLIGETEVVREVKSESEARSETESVSRSTSRTESETTGRSSSLGTSVSEGTNSSVNKGRNWGVNSGESRNFNWSSGLNWSYGGFLGGKKTDGGNEGKSDGRSYSEGKSKGWSEGSSEGVSHGTSQSRTDGTSESRTSGTSETEGLTRGTSQSRTTGTSETIQKRALITPDEIGQVFTRIDDKTRVAYPGLGLAVISGARPVIMHRVHYYEDYQFLGLFDPHPDYPYNAPKELTVQGSALGLSLAAYGLHLGDWSIAPGRIAAAGDEGALVLAASGATAARIRVPRSGMVTSVESGTGGDLPQGRLFSLLYYEDGAATDDPFTELRAVCDRIRQMLEAQQKEETQKIEQKKKQEVRNGEREKQLRRLLKGAAAVGALLLVVAAVALIKGSVDSKRKAASLVEIANHNDPWRHRDDNRPNIVSLRLYREACDLGNDDGCLKVADYYEHGFGVTPDIPGAAVLYRKLCGDHVEAACRGFQRMCKIDSTLAGCSQP